MSMITIQNLTFSYDGSYDDIFTGVTLQLDTDWKLGLVGRNGTGKTTFLNLLMGKFHYSGIIKSPVAFDYFPFEVPYMSLDTRQVVERIQPDYAPWELCREMATLEIPEETLDRPFDTLSKGEQTKILLAILFLKEEHFLLIDEPTNHLDAYGREIIGRYLNSKRGYILVSHDRTLLDRCVDHVLAINRTTIEIQQGNFSSWWRNKEYRDSFELAEDEKLRKDIGRLGEAAKRTAGWSDKVERTKTGFGAYDHTGNLADKGFIGHKAAKMMQRSKNVENRRKRAVEEKQKLLKNLDRSDTIEVRPVSHKNDMLVRCANLRISYDKKTICDKVTFTVAQGEQVALTGRNGSGKSSLLKLIMGEPISYVGSIVLAYGLKISYVPQDTSFLTGTLADYAEVCGVEESLFKAMLVKLGFSQVQFGKNMEDFSGGQKKKVLIAKSLCDRAHLYVWDEPFNFVDVISRMQIEQMLLDQRPTMIFVEHDQMFIDKVATKRIDLG